MSGNRRSIENSDLPDDLKEFSLQLLNMIEGQVSVEEAEALIPARLALNQGS